MKMARLGALLILTVMLVWTAGCSRSGDEDNPAGQASSSPSPQPATVTQEISIYYPDAEGMGVVEQKRSITYSAEQDKLEKVLAALQEDGEDNLVSLWKQIEFKQITWSGGDGKLTVDLHIPDEARLGGPGEDLALQTIQRTVFQLQEVKALDLLVDGQAVDSLMGHMELQHPIHKS
ncbi:GerMN domain-containing protein [Paenibacillus sp. GCM10023252]|uniref:GerMN domain-containing protein n=1 Tax=Paenibacillus sp. GCM10023252 TaxID=3252649 RepID=UPI00360E65E0